MKKVNDHDVKNVEKIEKISSSDAHAYIVLALYLIHSALHFRHLTLTTALIHCFNNQIEIICSLASM